MFEGVEMILNHRGTADLAPFGDFSYRGSVAFFLPEAADKLKNFLSRLRTHSRISVLVSRKKVKDKNCYELRVTSSGFQPKSHQGLIRFFMAFYL